MDKERWQRLQNLFAQALAAVAEERAAFVHRACRGDTALEAELLQLLAHADGAAPPAAGSGPSGDAVEATIERSAARWAGARQAGLIGLRLGPWRIVAHLADGGMGAVYRGERADGRYEQAVAIKLLNPALVSPAAHERLLQERQILARLTDPHIARLLDGGETDDGVPYLVMEFVDGLPIDRWCRERAGGLRPRLQLMVQVCRAVDHAHRNLVVHRDLKPSNILVDAQGAPRLLDFGIAKLTEADANVTASGERVMTPSHASPEQITGGAITTATDIYALGVLLYDLLTGRLPHAESSGNAAALARAIVETEPPRPSLAVSGAAPAATQRRGERLTPERLARELAGDLDNIVLMALRKQPERRYASAAELADDLERYLAHLPVRARPDTLGYRAAKFLRRHPVAVPATTLALVAALAGAALFTWRLADERDRARSAEQRARRTAAFTASVLERTGALQDADREISVKDLLERATARVRDELQAEPAVATRMRLALANAYSSWGEYTPSIELLGEALAETERRGAEADPERAEILQLMGSVTHDQGRLDESLALVQQAEALLRRIGPPELHARALSDVAVSLNALRRRSEAEPMFREALGLLRQAYAGDHAEIAWTLNNYAWCLHAMGRFEEALPLYEQALAMQQRLGTAVAERAQTRNNLAGVYYDRGDLERAGREWATALSEFESVFGPDGHAAVARGQGALAKVAIDRGRFDEAEQRSAAALATNRKLFGDRHRWTANTTVLRATALLGLGRLDEAEALYRQAQALRRELLPPAHADHVSPLIGLARVALARGQLPVAERELRAARAVIDSLSSPDRAHADELDWLLARTVGLQGRHDEARTLATGLLERMQRQLPPTHWRRELVEVAIALPPFVTAPTPAAIDTGRERLAQLRGRLGPEAFAVRDLAAALPAATP
ncbi:MAG: serine/threonine protein kinase [Piscinibacter sp.]|nr:serine/threonine protein kinase [Piscinibacter sp.]